MRTSSIALALFFMVVGCVLYRVKYEVDHLAVEHKTITQNIHKAQESIHILSAEWAHLNNPARIRKLATKYLDLQNNFPLQQVRHVQDNTDPVDLLDQESITPVSLSEEMPVQEIEHAPKDDAFFDLLDEAPVSKPTIANVAYHPKKGG
ncbi:MAG: hypothetical protein Q8K36_00535 [Alphaproteobacteria bacterium]|nr:hypothetical protein [Alphaproteobacteria bacterium]